MHITGILYDKPVRISITARADAELARRASPLRVEMELYFSCLIAKAVRFGEDAHGSHFEEVLPNLAIGFHAVQTQACHIDTLTTPRPPRTAFPITQPERFVPKWLNIDFKHGRWSGSFGLSNM